MTVRVLTVVGARPQFIKAAAVSRAIRDTAGLTEIMVHTGQHFDADMSDVFFDELGIPAPAHRLDIHGGGHGEMTGRMMAALEPVTAAEKPDWVLVYGDTNSTLAGALVAAKLHVPVAHVEAGLRSFNRRMPEEINRVVTDHVATLQFCPTVVAVENLADEGIRKGVHHVGDVMFDATLFAVKQAEGRATVRAELGLDKGKYALATVHRAENTDDPVRLAAVLAFLREQAAGVPVVLPLHPRTRQAVQRSGVSLEGLRVVGPVGYLDMAQLLAGATAVFTDSGGLQKEAYFHRVPCTTLRDETEWTETVTHGWNRLWQGPPHGPRSDITDYGDGRASDAIARVLKDVA
ncbi:non-hydrolyzing UDP-N-acetylglucosamine 2-epimerase [uncultured Alsobacter sp.]|uniref:non-hydrolyzing UDP-N-acetylglucosamine 2-epimerase n=1 Tax=uncultured Alsobacter sp. TaxID=1748258 RepID=UPI0025CCDD40|nr:UDP-N-acetylglucosamine 2-epimerase (non-hydrolyzing) [uncultured Alsobacter sp.]